MVLPYSSSSNYVFSQIQQLPCYRWAPLAAALAAKPAAAAATDAGSSAGGALAELLSAGLRVGGGTQEAESTAERLLTWLAECAAAAAGVSASKTHSDCIPTANLLPH